MTERAKYWQGVVAQWAASGQTQVAFCRQRRIEPGTFAWWKRQLRQRGLVGDRPDRSRLQTPVPKASGRFVEVGRSAWSPAFLEVLLAHGRTLRVPAGFDEQTLSRLLRVLEGVC